MKKILCITPVKHLAGVYDSFKSFGVPIYKPNIDKISLKKILLELEIEYIFTNPNKQGYLLDKDVLEGSSVKVINTCSTGTNHLDKDYCLKNNIEIWSLTKDMNLINELPSTSELAFGLMCSLFRKINPGFESVKNGDWNYEPFIGKQMKDSSVGIIGFGRLGKMMNNFCKAFGMKTYIYDPYLGYNNLSELLTFSDAISLHVHVNDETRGMIDKKFLENMKKGSYLINTSRGELVDELSIIKSIKTGHLYGYGTDVIKDEFGDRSKSDLVEFSKNNSNVIITPHVGGMTWEGQTKAYKWAISKFKNII
tara:strand:- start:66 stop:992 length:927 start_codon:yes stop_codon:yes gene_type:complete